MNLRKLLRREYGDIRNDDGQVVKRVRIKNDENTFKYDDREYIVNRKDGERFTIKGVFIHKTYYFYNINNPQPLKFNKTTKIWEPILDASVFKTLMENKVIIDLNTPPSNSLFKNLKPSHILLGLIVIGVLIYLAKGGKLA